MKKSSSSSTSGKTDRKTVEKNRRIHMKGLCFKLTSLIPPNYFKPSKDLLTVGDQLDQTTAYIKQLTQRIAELKDKKEETRRRMLNGDTSNDPSYNNVCRENNDHYDGTNSSTVIRLPILDVTEIGNSVHVVLISGLKKTFKFCEIVSILEEGGAEIVTASYTTVGDKVYHTIHAQAKLSRVGVEISRVCDRLQHLLGIHHFNDSFN